MKKIFDALLKPSRMILIIASFAYAGLYSIVAFGGIGGGFLPVMAQLIITVLTLCAIVAAPILLLIKKEEAAKLVFILVAGYFLLNRTQGWLGYAQWAGENSEGLPIPIGIFGFLAGLALAGVLVLLILHFILKKEVLKLSAVFAYVGAYFFFFVMSVLLFAYYCKLNADYGGNAVGWTSFVDIFADLIAPVAVLFGYLYFLGAPNYEFAKKAPKEKKPEPVEEQPAEQPAPEEAPAEEPAPEEEQPAE